MSRNIFLDCGTHEGQGMRELAPQLPKRLEVHCFEPNPRVELDVEKLRQSAAEAGLDFSALELHRAAIWITDGIVSFASVGGYPRGSDNGAGQASSIVNTGQHNVNPNLTSDVTSVNLVKFLRDLDLKEDDHVYIKMDIEGSEFEVVKSLIDDGSDVLHFVKTMWIEWHDHYFGAPGCRAEEREQLIAQMGTFGVSAFDWY